MERITVFTPTYNRAGTLGRVYESLLGQTFKDFKWIIVDDGSKDNTKDVVEAFANVSPFKIEYYYQENGGKHRAINTGLKYTTSELFLIADSDDSFTDDALEKFIEVWDSIPEADRLNYKGVILKCFDADTGNDIGNYPEKIFDSNDIDAFFKQKLQFEKWNIVRTDIMKEIPFPEPNEKLKFYPETVVWWRMARKYKTRYADYAVRAYYRDQENSLITQAGARSKETCYLWLEYINSMMDYFWLDPKAFAKAYIGFARDSILSNRKYMESIARIEKTSRKIIVTLCYPLGYIFAQKKKRCK